MFQHVTALIQLIETTLENLSTTEEVSSEFVQQVKDIGGKQNQNTELITFILHGICHNTAFSH